MKTSEAIKTVFQNKPQECGAACLCMVLNYFGMNLTLEDICFKHPVGDFVNAGDIVRMAKDYGFICRGFRRNPEDLKQIPTPAMLHWNFNHFVVLESFDENYYYINDPDVGRIRITPAAMDKSFTGACFIFEPNFKMV